MPRMASGGANLDDMGVASINATKETGSPLFHTSRNGLVSLYAAPAPRRAA